MDACIQPSPPKHTHTHPHTHTAVLWEGTFLATASIPEHFFFFMMGSNKTNKPLEKEKDTFRGGGFPDSSVGKESACNAGDPGSICGSGRSAGEGIGYPLQYSWASLVAQLVKNPPAMWETWVQSLGWEDPLEKGKATHFGILASRIPWTSVHGVTKSWTQLSNFHFQRKKGFLSISLENCVCERERERESLSVMSDFLQPLLTATHQAPLSMEFSRQEYWSALPFPSPGDLPDSGIEARSPTLQVDSWPLESPSSCPKPGHSSHLKPGHSSCLKPGSPWVFFGSEGGIHRCNQTKDFWKDSWAPLPWHRLKSYTSKEYKSTLSCYYTYGITEIYKICEGKLCNVYEF